MFLWKRNEQKWGNSSTNCIFEQVRHSYSKGNMLFLRLFSFSPFVKYYDMWFSGYLKNLQKGLKYLWLILCWQQVCSLYSYSCNLLYLCIKFVLTIICFEWIEGGTIVAALNILKDRGVTNKQIKVVMNTPRIIIIISYISFNHHHMLVFSHVLHTWYMYNAIKLYIFWLICLINGLMTMQISACSSPPALEKLSNQFPG